MFLRKLALLNFKNYRDATLEFHPSVNLFTGLNGSGKTNLLDAIHYLSMTKSYFNPADSQNILQGEAFFMLQGEFDVDGISEVLMCSVKSGQKKQFKRNRNDYERLSDHIGAFPVVLIAPTDQELLTGGSELRRRFADSIISQYDHVYLDDLIRYNHILLQRNTLIKQMSAKGLVNWSAMSIWDEQLAAFGEKIHKTRKEFIEGFNPFFLDLFHFVSGNNDPVSLTYESHYNEADPSKLLNDSRSRDLELQYTSTGVHKDDIQIKIRGFQARKYASQGQQKSVVIALKLAHYSYLRSRGFSKPVVLLDDIMDKLDENRVERLMELVSKNEFGQLFITDSHTNRLPAVFDKLGISFRHFLVNDGIINKIGEEVIS
jgi:DNA replication and repair protein RecF